MKNYITNTYMDVNRVLVFKSLDAKKQNSINKPGHFTTLYYCMRNFCNLIGLEQWYFCLI